MEKTAEAIHLLSAGSTGRDHQSPAHISLTPAFTRSKVRWGQRIWKEVKGHAKKSNCQLTKSVDKADSTAPQMLKSSKQFVDLNKTF